MKKPLFLVLFTGMAIIFLSIPSCNPPQKEGLFYYGTQEKVKLTVPKNKIIVKFTPKTDPKEMLRNLEQYGKKQGL